MVIRIPIAGPLIATITGFFNFRYFSMLLLCVFSLVSFRCGRFFPEKVLLPPTERSAPAQKPQPAPVRIVTLISGSFSTSIIG